MTDDHCKYCGHLISPCANCGGTTGHMVETHGAWFHERQVDCIVQLQSDLEETRARVAELETFLSAYDDRPQENQP